MYDNLEYMRNKKTVVITGGNRGIGLGITKVFLKNNYIVIVGSRSPIVEDLNNFKNSIIHLKIDVKKEDDHIKIAKLAIEKTGRLDCYINNAGYSKWKPIDKIDNLFLSEIIEHFWAAIFRFFTDFRRNFDPQTYIDRFFSISAIRLLTMSQIRWLRPYFMTFLRFQKLGLRYPFFLKYPFVSHINSCLKRTY